MIGSEEYAKSPSLSAAIVCISDLSLSRTRRSDGTFRVKTMRAKDFVLGIYPMLQDETCFLLAVDFDKEGLARRREGVWETCGDFYVPAALGTFSLGQWRARLDFFR